MILFTLGFIVGAVVSAVAIFAWCLCVSAKLADGQNDNGEVQE